MEITGRPRKPTEMQKGHMKVVDIQKKKAEERAVSTDRDQLKKPPNWLIDTVAKKEWKRITEELKEINLVGNLDRNNLGGYCNAYANYIKVTEKLKDEDFCIERHTRTGTIVVRNPMIDIQKLYAEEMRKFAALCGLTIDSRLKAASIKTNEEQDSIEAKFGI